MPNLKVAAVKNLETVFDFNYKNKEYQAFLAARKIWKKLDGETNLKKAAEKCFSDFLAEYLDSLSMNIRGNGSSIYLRKGNNIDIYCQGIKIIPGRGEYLDGYEPELEFCASEKELTATAGLRQTGTWQLDVINDFIQLLYSSGDGMITPKIKIMQAREADKRILIASTDCVPKVITAMHKIYQDVGKARFAELREILKVLQHTDTGKAPAEILRQEYDKRLALLRPSDL